MNAPSTSFRNRRHAGAFSLIELLVAVSIMTVIILGLYTVFDQTQRAMRNTMSQVDVMEGVRATSDLVGRELERAAYLPLPWYTNLYVSRSPFSRDVELQNLAGGRLLTTVLQDVFFHTRVGDEWSGIGFWVGPINTNLTAPLSVGRLYRFTTNVSLAQVRRFEQNSAPNRSLQRNPLLTAFQSDRRFRESSVVMDGIVHLRVIAYGAGGIPLYGTNLLTWDREFERVEEELPAGSRQSYLLQAGPGESVLYQFYHRSFPTAPVELELELGVLEPQVVKQYLSIAMAQPAAAADFLARHAGKIHLFRQRIPLRNASPF